MTKEYTWDDLVFKEINSNEHIFQECILTPSIKVFKYENGMFNILEAWVINDEECCEDMWELYDNLTREDMLSKVNQLAKLGEENE